VSVLVWVMIGIAIWHFTVFVPDRFFGGIVGAFLAAVIAAVVFGFAANGASIPGEHATHLGQALIAIPGSLIGLGLSYLYGWRMDARAGVDHAITHAGRR
jgi:hypothetical protein